MNERSTKPQGNPYETASPEWQLYESAVSAETLARSFNEEAQRAMKKSQEARERGERFREALAKLTSEAAE